MDKKTDIRYLRHHEIDKEKWDDCIQKAENGLIYGCTYYLDHTSANWDALVLGDYVVVMPLCFKRKYGIYYLYQPFLTSQSGVFGNNISGKLVNAFLKSIPEKYKYWDIPLNYANRFHLADFSLYTRRNLVLNLDKPYEKLHQKFAENTKRNIRKAIAAGCVLKDAVDINNIMPMAMPVLKKIGLSKKEDLRHFKTLYKYLSKKGQAETPGVYNENNILIASAVFFFFKERAFYILVANSKEGKKKGASHFLINAFIQKHAGVKLILDFEGSDAETVARFYKSFGAKEENYAAIRMNRLPHLLKWMKK